MSQRLDPDSDVSAGDWISAPLFSKVNDGASPDDGTLITVELLAETSAVPAILGLSNPGAVPGAGTNTVTFRARIFELGVADPLITVTLFEGVTQRGQLATAVDTSITNYTFNPTGITNYNNLTIQLDAYNGDIIEAQTFQISHIKMDVPDGAAAGGSGRRRVHVNA